MLDSDFKVLDTITADSLMAGDVFSHVGAVWEAGSCSDLGENIRVEVTGVYGDRDVLFIGAWDEVELVTYA